MHRRRKQRPSKFSRTSPLQRRKKSLCGKAPNIPLKWEATYGCRFRRIHMEVALGTESVRLSKKIEQEASSDCRYSEYLTLLNTSQDATTRDRHSPNEYNVREGVVSTPQND